MTKDFTDGDSVRVKATFEDIAGDPIDPTAVLFGFLEPGGSVVTYTYGVSAQLVRDSAGVYHVDLDTTGTPGRWVWKFYATGTGQVADEGFFYVRRSLLD